MGFHEFVEDGEKVSNRQVGYGLVFGVPKSLSIYLAITGDGVVENIARSAVDETMRAMESEMQCKVRSGGLHEDRRTGELLYSRFFHRDSRPINGLSDPHWHVHCFLHNATFDPVEERWKAGQFRGLIADKHGIVRRHGMLRKFSPALLDALELTQDVEGEQSACLRALQMLKELNATGRRKLPEDAPTDFLSRRLKPIVINQGEIDRRAWECALLLKLRDELKAGNLSVRYSKRFARLEEFFIDDYRWQGMCEDFFRRSGLPSDSKQVPEYLARRLGEAYERFLKTAPSNSYALVDKDGWHLSAEPTEKLDQEGQDRLAHLKSWLAKHMRRVKLPDLLIEVDNQLAFTRNFLTPAQREEPSPEDICAVLAAVMAHGCNLGVYTMAQLTSNVTYEQLKRIGDWHLTEEGQRSALAELVSAITDLDTSARWGQGKTAASDGQRFSLPRRVLQQTYSTRFSDFALEFYTFVADNYAPFYSMPIECADRDAAFVLDGLLYNESELEIEEHYTDTHGYTELGLRFCPRIRGVQHQRIYRIDPNRDYGSLASLISRADQTIDTEQIAEHWDRMGQLYASLKTGHVTASVALKRLVGFSGKNRFYRANRDLGRIFKTEFILQHLSEPELPRARRIRRGLLKVEQLHALARDVFYGRRGRINARELWEQMNTCSCLNLILACIVHWQACEISRVLSECDPIANGITRISLVPLSAKKRHYALETSRDV